jgi:outer membrane protein TolC
MTGIALALALLAAPASPQDTLRLPALQQAALARDPRARQAALQERATALRLRNLDVERLPALTGRAQATHQSEVPVIPISLPGGAVPPEPPKDQYEARVEVEQLLYDGGVLSRRRDAERAQLGVEQARIAADLQPLKDEVNEAFFTAFLLQERAAEISTLIEDLEARLTMLRSQVRAGAALPGDTAVVMATALRAIEDRAEVASGRRAALGRLSVLTGMQVSTGDVLALPQLAGAVESLRGAGGSPGAEPAAAIPAARPEYAVFAGRRERLSRDAAVISARLRPQVSAFAQLAVGRPGFAQFERELHDYWVAGVRMRWAPFNWGTSDREHGLLEVQRQIVDSEEAAFTARLQRQVQDELADMERLETALETDERIIALREQVERQARAQLGEHAITAAAYVDVRTDLQDARLLRQRHRVELARARAGYLTTLGIELR